MKCNMDIITFAILVLILLALLYYNTNNNENFVLGINTCELATDGVCKNAPDFSNMLNAYENKQSSLQSQKVNEDIKKLQDQIALLVKDKDLV
jgi:hypothetical protein